MENEITVDGGVCENNIICPQSITRSSDSSMVDLTMESEENYTGEVSAVANEKDKNDNYIDEVSKPIIDYVTVSSVMKTEEEAIQPVQRDNKRHFTNFRINTNNKKSLIYQCKHAVNRDTRSKGKRVRLHANF